MAAWTTPTPGKAPSIQLAGMCRHWQRLHVGDCEALPPLTSVRSAWLLFHRGELHKAFLAATQAGAAGFSVACKSACVYGSYVEPHEKNRLELFLDVAARAERHISNEPQCASAHYWHAYALSRYSQGISVARALAQGIGSKVKTSLETTIALQPKHAGALMALASFHADVIDKVGVLIGNMTYGVRRDISLELLDRGLKLAPHSPGTLVEYARTLLLLEGEARQTEALDLYREAAAVRPLDAQEYLDVQFARAALADQALVGESGKPR
jgi:hypothetical protein